MKLADIKFSDFSNSDNRLEFYKSTIAPALGQYILDKFASGAWQIPNWNAELNMGFFMGINHALATRAQSDILRIATEFRLAYSTQFLLAESMIESNRVSDARKLFEDAVTNPEIRCSRFFFCFKRRDIELAVGIRNGEIRYLRRDPVTNFLSEYDHASQSQKMKL